MCREGAVLVEDRDCQWAPLCPWLAGLGEALQALELVSKIYRFTYTFPWEECQLFASNAERNQVTCSGLSMGTGLLHFLLNYQI